MVPTHQRQGFAARQKAYGAVAFSQPLMMPHGRQKKARRLRAEHLLDASGRDVEGIDESMLGRLRRSACRTGPIPPGAVDQQRKGPNGSVSEQPGTHAP